MLHPCLGLHPVFFLPPPPPLTDLAFGPGGCAGGLPGGIRHVRECHAALPEGRPGSPETLAEAGGGSRTW